MVKSILFTFEDEHSRDHFIQILNEVSTAMLLSSNAKDYETRKNNGTLLKDTLNTVKFDPQLKVNSDRQCGLWVSGQKLIEGSYSDMNKRFDDEIVAHSARVEVKEMRDGKWVSIRSRRL